MEYVSRALVAVQYTGSATTADVQAAAGQISQLTGNTWTVQSDDGQTLVLRESNPSGLWADWAVTAGQVVVIDPSRGIIDRISPAEFSARYLRAVNVSDTTLIRGLNSPAWLTALAGKLGITPK